MSSFWGKLARTLTSRKRPIGYDLQGNAYFETPNPNGGRPKRTVEYKEQDPNRDDYRTGTKQLPVQWQSWMSWTRSTPPSLAELQADAARLARLQPLIARIEERETAERIAQGYLLPDGSEPSDRREHVAMAHGSLPAPGEKARKRQRFGLVAEEAPADIEDAVAAHSAVAPPATKVDAATFSEAETLRRLAEEDTKRRLRESGVSDAGSGAGVEGVQGVGRAFKPRRRGQQ
ncbi:NADH-ubiquinone oxidoreductase assembly factor N7BML [Vanrija pseudolonga]|uniref:NADH-ubiquinone oxidoreductase assembly factor N7BML n=1 Tax=Vanrija pseudolonga TaxID=143232 RepID=A0AAF0Y430_9TREE|nr:NADH-ubiquinone oxidoreductase assembly factor N7BML [Vanrija pseudolonga]